MSETQSFAQRRASGLNGRSASHTAPSAQWQTHSRKSSQSSQTSNAYGRPGSGLHGDIDSSLNGLGAGNGLGSLADELDDGWDEEDTGYETNLAEGAHHGDLGFELDSAEERSHAQNLVPPLSPSKRRPGSPRKDAYNDSAYDGSEYGDERELEPAEGITPSLERWMGEIEALARQGADVSDPLWSRFATSLNDLPSQFELENNAGRLVTACSAATSHLTNHSRAFTTTTHSLVSPFALPPDPSDIDEILPLVASLVTMLPKPPSDSVMNLRTLNNQTADLLTTLSTLGDSLYMVRQTSTTASRRLRASRDVVDALRKEMDQAEEGESWLERGAWDEKIKNREARKTCEDVVGGFEQVCNEWRQRLIDNYGGVGALDTAAA